MGIHNLLPFVKKACREGNVREFSGCSVAVDVSCLLHKGLFGCSESIAQGKKTTFYIYYVKKHIRALLDLGCHVIMVFDGRPLPAKKNTNDERRQKRADNVRAAEVLLSEGKVNEAVNKFKQATSITPEVVENTIEHFRKLDNVDVIVSPYESDAQLAFLVNEGFADVVITEDSDLIAFGCEKIIFKWNCDSGECTVYERKELPRCFSGVMSSQFDFTKFRRICILSGCDYLQAGLPGIGLNKALAFFSKTSRTDLKMLLPRIPSYLNMSKLTVSKEFIQEFIRAENTFIHQVVFDPRQRCQRPLTPYPVPQKQQSDENDDDFATSNDKDDYSYAGEVLSSNLAVRLALGNQIENSVIMDKFFLPSPVPDWSVWCDQFESCGKRKRRIDETQKEEAKKCGSTFTFDSPSKKRAKLDPTDIDVIDLDVEDNPEAAEAVEEGVGKNVTDQRIEKNVAHIKKSSSLSSLKKENLVTRPKRLRNQASCDWTVDEIMKAYGSTEQERSSASVPASPDPGLEKKSIIAATTSTHVTGVAPTTSIIATCSSSGRSAYFVKRTAGCANPFRKPLVKSSSLNTEVKHRHVAEDKAKTETVEKEDEDELLSTSIPIIKPVGCRASGLHASFSG